MESEEKKGFTVQDRRRFSAEGDVKEPASEDKPEPKESAPLHQASVESTDIRSAARTPESATEINFATFIVGLSTEALSALGEIPHPATGERSRDLDAAQQLIDIIGMLRDKTRGNLDVNEENLIEAILFDLRMKYVELARQPGR